MAAAALKAGGATPAPGTGQSSGRWTRQDKRTETRSGRRPETGLPTVPDCVVHPRK